MRLTAVHSEPILRLLSTLNEVSLLSEPRQRRGGVMKEAGVAAPPKAAISSPQRFHRNQLLKHHESSMRKVGRHST